MPDTCQEAWRASLAAELIVWAVSSATFLLVYIASFDAAHTVALAHLSMLAIIWLGMTGLRLLNWEWTPGRELKKWIAAILIALPWICLVSWYALVLAGLSSWGRVTTWPLIQAYAAQTGALIETLGLPKAFPATAALLAIAFPIIATRRWLVPRDWSKALAASQSSTTTALFGIMLCLTFAHQTTVGFSAVPAHAQEPIRLSFFPHRGGVQRQSHVLTSSPQLDATEKSVWDSYQTKKLNNPPNIILIVGDALRADHMSIYGYDRSTTPTLDALAKNGSTTVIKKARSVCAESTCGLLSIAASRTVKDLPSRPMTLHEVLRRNGYSTHMILSGDHTNFYGLREAYGTVDSYHDGSVQGTRYMNDDALVLDQALSLDDHDPSRPVMMQFHLMSTHGLGLRHESSQKFQPYTNYYLWPQNNRVAKTLEDATKAINYYDNGMVQFDAITAELLQILENKGYLKSALVVITGDHGEMLGEHGRFGHRHRVNETVLNIPLLFMRFGYEGALIKDSVLSSQIDIAPTILAEIGLPLPSTWQGIPLQSPEMKDRLIHFQQATSAGIYATNGGSILKYWKDFITNDEYVFDVTNDPLERHNLISELDPKNLDIWRSATSSARLVTEGHIP